MGKTDFKNQIEYSILKCLSDLISNLDVGCIKDVLRGSLIIIARIYISPNIKVGLTPTKGIFLLSPEVVCAYSTCQMIRCAERNKTLCLNPV